MRNYSKVAAAVAVALSGGSAFAQTNPAYTLSLNIVGSAAMRDAVIAEFDDVLCQSGTLAGPFVSTQGTPTASGGLNPDFRGLTCTLQDYLGVGTNTIIAVYYRTEGDSILPVLVNPALNGGTLNGTSIQLNRLNIGPAGGIIGGAQPPNFNVFETVSQLQADSQTGEVVKDTVDLGISDVEPAAFVGENYGSEYTFIPFAPPTAAQLSTVPTFGPVVGQVFTPIVSNTGGTAGFHNISGFSGLGLTTQELATIFSGAVSDWSLVPSAAAAGAKAPAPITICRREPGSGTQVVTSTHFLETNCSSGGRVFATSASGVKVVTNFTGDAVLNCVKNNPGAIGVVALQRAATLTSANATQITIDSTLGTAVNAAQGKYSFYAEAYLIKNTQVSGALSTLITRIVTDLETATIVPQSQLVPNLVALPTHNAPYSPVTPFPSGSGQQIPIAIGDTGGDTCSPLLDDL